MPIDYKKYPSNFKTEIRPSVLKRAKNCCEFCRVPNYAVGHISNNGSFVPIRGHRFAMGAPSYRAAKMLLDSLNEYPDFPIKYIVIVLTIAHLDHKITNNDLSNLKFLCQKCHLDYDKEHRKKSRAKNRKLEKGLMCLFDS